MLEADKVRQKHSAELIEKPSVIGVGVGHKWVDGSPSDTPAILVFVEKKRSKRSVTQKFSIDELIPANIDGIPTDVIEVGRLVKQSFTQRVRPIKPGYSVGQRNVSAGTIGGIFLDRDNEPVILSNNHILADEGKAKFNDPIYQPGPFDNKSNLDFKGWIDPVSELPYVATLKKYVQLRSINNKQDSAIARLHPKIISGGLVDQLFPVLNRACVGFGVPTIGMQVQKCGRTTGYTTGKIIGLNASFTIQYDFGPAMFENCIVITPLSKGGDSGSLILDMSMKSVAMLFAGSPKATIATPISTIVDEYGLKIWSPSKDSDVVGVDTLDFGDKTWQTVTAGGSITNNGKVVTISSAANDYAYLESPVPDFNTISVTVNTGTDKGATWGPGLTVQWPNGTMKINVRHNDRFGGYFNGKFNINVGSVKPNTEYTIRIKKTPTKTYLGEIFANGKWFTVLELPASMFSGPPVSVRVGKTDLSGKPSNHTTHGEIGVCHCKNFTQT